MKKSAFLLFLCFFSCGIERTIPILKPPVAGVVSEASDTFVFYNTIEDEINRDSFKGFEIYYKFYKTSEAADAEKNIASYESMELMENNTQTRFWRLNAATDTDRINKPLIKIPVDNRTGISKFTIDFTSLSNASISAVPESVNGITFSNLPIYRGVKDEDLEYKDFNTANIADLDISALGNITAEVYLAIYVFSYGVYDLSKELHSIPVWLTKIKIQFPN